jgi:hypothetical protein
MSTDLTPLSAPAPDLAAIIAPSAPPATPDVQTVPPAPPASATPDARRIAGAILEVLAGVRSITDAALLLGVTPARYYALEARAVAGLIAACEPRGPGPLPGGALSAEVDRLRAERDRLRDEAARYQALARIAQTAFGPPGGGAAPAASTAHQAGLTVRQQRAARAAARATPPPVAVKTRKKRIPTVRALRLAQQVQQVQHSATSPGSPPAGRPPTAAGG